MEEEDQLVELETAKLAKKCGYRIESDDYFNIKGEKLRFEHWGDPLPYGCCFIPTQSLLNKWLRETRNLLVYVTPTGPTTDIRYQWFIYGVMKDVVDVLDISHEDAMERGLQEALKLI
jgi:hypothetical protein